MKAFVAGAGGFIGGHVVRRLLNDGLDVVGADVKPLAQWRQRHVESRNIQADLREYANCSTLAEECDLIYHLAADVGGIGYITRHDWECALSAQITQNLLTAAMCHRVGRFLYASSACVYPPRLQTLGNPVPLDESMAVPADPEGGYGWSKLFSERLCAYAKEHGLETRVARLFNVYGPYCDVSPVSAKAPAALCRKFVRASMDLTPTIELWGSGQQVRSFLYVDDCLDAFQSLIESSHDGPVNIASDECVSMRQVGEKLASISKTHKDIIPAQNMPEGVGSRIPSVELANSVLGWKHKVPLDDGLCLTYEWVAKNVREP